MAFILPFEKINKNDIAIAGGKAASLGEMVQNGIPVPNGFVLLTTAYQKFISDNTIDKKIIAILESIPPSDSVSIEEASRKICMLIEHAPISEDIVFQIAKHFTLLGVPYVAVRSSASSEDSAEASWAGQLDSYLNTTEEILLQHIRKCWRSLFTPRAIAYRLEKELKEKDIEVAVIVQKMVKSEAAGVVFSVHPVTEDDNQLLAEAGFGLGESIVSGAITPDSYVVGKNPRRIIQITISEKNRALVRSADKAGNQWVDIEAPKAYRQALSNEQILKLTDIVIGIEKRYGFPCDVEWALEKGKFYILQSRPITTLKKKKPLHFHYANSDLGVLHHDIILAPENYGSLDYRVLFEDGIVRAYLTDAGIAGAREAGMRLLENSFVLDLQKRAAELEKAMSEYEKPAVGSVALQEWEKILTLWRELWAIYFYCEQPVHSPLEEMIARKDEGSDRLLATLEVMGKIKLDLHVAAENIINKGFETIAKLLQKKYGITSEEFHALRNEEVGMLLKSETIDFDLVRARLSGCVFISKDGSWECLSGNAFKEQKKAIEENLPKEVRGASAYPGITKGVVVTHLSWTGVREIPEGAVLVTGMTNPQMIPYIRRAAAIITDEGGLMCHAAIIAREWKVPCIVGTKAATQLLHDGDLVEVDANIGMVRIIEE